jgi:DNA-directed RNA polymerase alpha subunit
VSIEEEIKEIVALEELLQERKAASLAFLGPLLPKLGRGGVHHIGELLTKTEDDLLNITNFGQKSLDELKQKLDERGLTLRN